MITIKDVAKKAGVSVGTVSKVINNIYVKPDTKKYVDDAIVELGYEPNVYARGLKTNKTNTIALILPTVWNPFFGELAYEIEKNLRNYDLKMILCNSENNYLTELKYIEMAKQNKVDGIISISYSNIDPYISTNMPIVSIDRFFSETIPYISSDNLNGGYIAAKELTMAGASKVAILGRGSNINNSTRDRVTGFINFCEQNNISYENHYYTGHSTEFEDFLNNFLEVNFNDSINFDGLFCITDEYAMKVIEKLQKYNVNIPDDIQIIGYDGVKSSKNSSIKISTIRQPLELIAENAVSTLLSVINKENVNVENLIPVKFIKGYTTK